MPWGDPDELGKCIRREVYDECLHDESTGEEHHFSAYKETTETCCGSIEDREYSGGYILECGHVRKIGERASRCTDCSKELKRSTLVCNKCAIICPYCGKSSCLKHSQPHHDGNRYCSECTKKRRFLPQPPAEKGSSFCGDVLNFGIIGKILRTVGRLLKSLLVWW